MLSEREVLGIWDGKRSRFGSFLSESPFTLVLLEVRDIAFSSDVGNMPSTELCDA